MIDESRQLAHDWFPRSLPTNVELGQGSWIYSSFAFVHYRSRRPCGVRIGHDTGIYNGTFFDLDVDGHVIIGNYCTLVGAIIGVNGRVSIGDYVFISHEVTIADHFAAVPPEDTCDARQRNNGSEIWIGEGAWIGARAILLPGARIGVGAVVGAASVVATDVPAFSVVGGNPARRVK